MSFNWRKIDAKNWRLDDTWAITQDASTGQWYVAKDGKQMLENHDTVESAMRSAESARKASGL